MEPQSVSQEDLTNFKNMYGIEIMTGSARSDAYVACFDPFVKGRGTTLLSQVQNINAAPNEP